MRVRSAARSLRASHRSSLSQRRPLKKERRREQRGKKRISESIKLVKLKIKKEVVLEDQSQYDQGSLQLSVPGQEGRKGRGGWMDKR